MHLGRSEHPARMERLEPQEQQEPWELHQLQARPALQEHLEH